MLAVLLSGVQRTKMIFSFFLVVFLYSLYFIVFLVFILVLRGRGGEGGRRVKGVINMNSLSLKHSLIIPSRA